MIVPRTCTEISTRDADHHREQESQPLEAFLDAPAYVLLGDPGAGKTTAFEAECEEFGEKACLITARDFLTFDPQSHPEWHDKTLFIDGLDEIRVGADDARTPFDQIRGRLDALGKPHFRLSCREADWLGANDQKHLESVSTDSKVTVLRLNPLTDSDIADILNARPDIDDAQAFIAAAEERGVDGLLTNPQTLNMLADVVAQGGGWPKSRKETFEMACGQMVREHNEEHEAAQESNSPPSSDQLLDAAGQPCAVQLISGAAGYTLRGQADEDYPFLDQCNSDNLEMLRHALTTKLSKGVSNNRFAPIHRHIAEFLGARYLAEVIKSGLPARRIIALIVGEDGTVVTEMRGLSAWLAAHSKDARADLIERDPIGVVLYGDIREYSTGEKRALLKALKLEASRLDSVFLKTSAFGVLATPDMEPVLKKLLNNKERDEEHQTFIGFVLDILREGGPLPNLSELLLEIVRDETWWPCVNYAALDAFIHLDSEDKTGKLKALLADIQSGDVSDPNSELFGTLLIQLYPQDIFPSKVWDYLSGARDPERSYGIDMYRYFWESELLGKSSDEQVAELLDHLHERLPGLQPTLDDLHLNGLPLKLLACGLKAHGDQLDTASLYDWLGVGMTERGSWAKNKAITERGSWAIQEIRAWLEQRPEVEKAILTEGLARCSESDEFKRQAFNRLYGAGLPPDFGLWCQKQAIALADAKPRVAELLSEWDVSAKKNWNDDEDLSFEVPLEQAHDNEQVQAIPDIERLRPSLATPPESITKEQEEGLNLVRSNKTALRENRAAPDLLHRIGFEYFGFFYDFSGDKGLNSIKKWLLGNSGLINAALEGLRGTIDREDVPSVEEILGLKKKGHAHYFGLPFLAGLAEVERTAPEDPSQWDGDRIRKAIGFYYCTPHANYRPQWYRRLLTAHPEVVAEVQVQFAAPELQSGRTNIHKLSELAHDPEHAQVARYASLPLLKSFPIRCKLELIEHLNHLLWAALQQHADRSSLQELIKKKLSRKSMDDAQRVHWLAAGVIVSPREYEDCLRDFVQVRESRIRHLVAFFDNRVQFSFDVLGIPGLERLVGLLGSYIGPRQSLKDGGSTPILVVHKLIQCLAASPTKDASDALDRLLADPALSRWRDVLSQAQDVQRVTWRDASYRHPTIEQVCQTLNDGTPANAADLAALLVDRFDEIANRIGTNNANHWRPYWNEDENQKPTNPKHENSCRDALLDDLRLYFTNTEPEMKYVNDKRADIRVSYGDFQVPVEIKKNSHQKLWSSMRNQLIAKYTIDPNTDGYGIYLVFWFGKDRTPPPPSGTRPTNAQELKKRLEATLSPDEVRKISVCVIDVSRPD